MTATEVYPGQETARVFVVSGHDSDVLASVPLHGHAAPYVILDVEESP